MVLNRPITDNERKKSLNSSVGDGSFWSVMDGFGNQFFSAFAVFLKATNLELGFLSSFPQMIGSFFQLLSNKFIRLFGSRKNVVLLFATLQALIHIPIALSFFLGEYKAIYLILFICMYFIFSMIANPAWTSWMGDLVDENKRGKYFGFRNRVTNFVSFVSFLLAGFILQKFSNNSYAYYGFLILFSISLFSRLVSVLFLSRQVEPKFELLPQERFGLFKFIKNEHKTNFGLFVVFLCFLNFAVYVSAPFYTPYMLKDLHFSFFEFAIVNAAALIARIIFMPLWGKATDRFGEKKVIITLGIFMPFTPIVWLFSTNLYYLILANAFGGFVWAGFDLSVFNYVFSLTSKEKRVSYVAYYNVLAGIFSFLGSIAGTALVKYNTFFWSQYLFVFLMSGVLRALAFLLFVPLLKNTRKVESISSHRLIIDVLLSMPGATIKDIIVPITKTGPMRKIIPRSLIRRVEDMFSLYPRSLVRDVDEMLFPHIYGKKFVKTNRRKTIIIAKK